MPTVAIFHWYLRLSLRHTVNREIVTLKLSIDKQEDINRGVEVSGKKNDGSFIVREKSNKLKNFIIRGTVGIKGIAREFNCSKNIRSWVGILEF